MQELLINVLCEAVFGPIASIRAFVPEGKGFWFPYKNRAGERPD